MTSSPNNRVRRYSPQWMLRAYAQGYFPMAEDRHSPMEWYSANPRGVLPLDGFHVPRRLARTVRQGRFEIRVNTAFGEVMLGCADRPSTWISDDILANYLELHGLGWAHSLETWREERLVGGIYGIALGGAFLAESMFHLERDASNVALVHLVRRLRQRDFRLLDLQIANPHTERFGVVEIDPEEYLKRLRKAMALQRHFD